MSEGTWKKNSDDQITYNNGNMFSPVRLNVSFNFESEKVKVVMGIAGLGTESSEQSFAEYKDSTPTIAEAKKKLGR